MNSSRERALGSMISAISAREVHSLWALQEMGSVMLFWNGEEEDWENILFNLSQKKNLWLAHLELPVL